MLLGDFPVVFNTNVVFKEALSYDEKGMVALFSEVMNEIPGLNDYSRAGDDEFHLVERTQGRLIRQLRFQKKRITFASGTELALDEADRTARIVYGLVSRRLAPNSLLIELLDVSFRFEFPYRGNHDELVLTELFKDSPFDKIARETAGAVRRFQPTLTLSLSADHSLVALIDFTTGTSPREIESGVYDGDEIQLVCGVAKIRGLAGQALEETYSFVHGRAIPFLEDRVLPLLVKPLWEAVSASQGR